MSTDLNKRNVRRIPEELYNEGRLEVADEVFMADYIEHFPLPPGFPTGLEGVKSFVTLIREAFEGFSYTVDDLVGEGDRVAIRVTGRGTQTGAFMGIPPSGKPAIWSEIHICRMSDGRLAEHWVVSDRLGMLEQLGVIPQSEVTLG